MSQRSVNATLPTIGLDVRMVQFTGIGTYIREILRNFLHSRILQEMKLRLFGPKSHLSEFENVPINPFYSKIYSLQEQLEYPLRLKKCALWHAPHYNIPFFKGKTKLIVTVHDLIHWIYRKEFFNRAQALYASVMFKRLIPTADHIITVSERTKWDLVEHFDASPQKIRVIYEGVNPEFRPLNPPDIEEVKKRYQIPERYFLCIGSLKPHKNILWLVRLYREMLKEKNVQASLLIVGRKNKKYSEEFAELADLKTEKGIVYIPEVPFKDLVALYSGALALIHPSLYEGFGLPLLESMACGTPVIAFKTASIPEVVGDAAHLVSLNHEDEMVEAIIDLQNNSQLRETFRSKGFENIKRFSWKRAAEQTIEVYKTVLTSN